MKGEKFSQIRGEFIDDDLERIIVNQNSWTAGELDHSKRTFYSVPRSAKNLFHLFHGAEGGLGINEEILLRPDFEKIKVKFNDKILITTRLKWLNLGIVSPYCNQAVDKQIILRLSQINTDEVDKYEPAEIQENMFEKVSNE